MITKQDAVRRLKSLDVDAKTWEPIWKDQSRFIRPTRGNFDSQPNKARIIDNKAQLSGHSGRAVRILAAGMVSGLTSPSRPWAKIEALDPELTKYWKVKEYFDECTQRMFGVFSRSNIYGVLNSVYEELGTFGTAAMPIDEDDHDIIRARGFTCGEYRIGLDGQGRVNTFARRFNMNVGQIASTFGLDSCSDKIKSLHKDGKLDEWIKLVHLIEQNSLRNQDSKLSKDMPFSSYYWEDGSSDENFLRVSGFMEMPVMCPRWDVIKTDDSYGVGPSWDCLADTKMHQKMVKDKLYGLDMVMRPPIQRTGSTDSTYPVPGGVSFTTDINPNAGARAVMQINPDLNAIRQDIAEVKRDISEAFYSDLFLMMSHDDRSGTTAREIVERHEEKMLMLGPVLFRVESELLDPMINRVYGIMNRKGLLPIPPRELMGQELKIEYTSILAQAQKMVGTTSIEQTLRFAGSLAAMYPEVRKAIKPIDTVLIYGEQIGASPKIFNSKEEIEEIDRQEKEAQAIAQQQQYAMESIAAAKGMSDIKVGENNALNTLLGGGV